MTTATTDAPAASSAAPSSAPAAEAPKSGQDALDKLSPEARTQYELTGEMPDAGAAPKGDDAAKEVEGAGSTPAKPAEQAAPNKTGAKPEEASSPSTPEKPEDKVYKEKTEKRFNEILDDNRELRRRLDELSRGGVAPKREEPAEVTLESVIERPDVSRAPMGEGDFFAQFPSAGVGDYARYVTSHTMKVSEARAHQQQGIQKQWDAINERGTSFHTKVKAATEADATLATRISPEVQGLVPIDALMAARIQGDPNVPEVTGRNVIAQELVMSENPIPLMEHFSANPAELQRIASLPNTVSIVRELAKLESRLASPATAGGGTAAPKTVSSAPAPPATVGSKPAAPTDEIERAVAANDFEGYAREANKREMAASGKK